MAFASNIAAGAGTIAIAGTAVTGTGTAFAAGDVGKLLYMNATTFGFITAFTSTTAVTIDRSLTVAAGSTYQMASTITQSGTDANPTGLAAIAGVTTVKKRDITEYLFGSLQLVITGSLTIPDSYYIGNNTDFNALAPGNSITVNSGGSLTLGAAVSTVRSTGNVTSYPQRTGIIMQRASGDPATPAQRGLRVLSGGTLTANGGFWTTHQSIDFQSGCTVTIRNLTIVATSDLSYQNLYISTTAHDIDGLKVYSPTSQLTIGLRENGTQFKGLEIVNGRGGIGTIDPWSGGRVINVTDYKAGAAQYDFTLRGGSASPGGDIFYNCKGSNLGHSMIVYCLAANQANGAVRHWIRFKPKVTDSSNNGVAGAKLFARDSNSGTRSNRTNYYFADQTYTLTTPAGGQMAAATEILTGVCHNGGVLSQQTFSWDSRLPVNGAVLHYNQQITGFTISDATVADQNTVIKALNDTTVVQGTLATVAAYTDCSNLDRLRDLSKWHKVQTGNEEVPTLLTELVTPNGTVLSLGNRNLVVDATAAAPFAFNSGTNTITVKASTLAEGTVYKTVTTTGTVSVANGATISALYTDVSGARWRVTVGGMVSGSALLIRRTDTSAVLYSGTPGTSYALTYIYTADMPVEIVVRKATSAPYYQEWRTTATLGASVSTVTANQTLDQ